MNQKVFFIMKNLNKSFGNKISMVLDILKNKKQAFLIGNIEFNIKLVLKFLEINKIKFTYNLSSRIIRFKNGSNLYFFDGYNFEGSGLEFHIGVYDEPIKESVRTAYENRIRLKNS